MRGFAIVSIVLIGAYVVLNNKNALNAASTGGGVLVTALQHLISDKVAAIPQIKSAIPQASAAGPSIVAPGPNGNVPIPGAPGN